MSQQINCVGCDESPGSITLNSSVLISKMFTEVTALKVKSSYTICKSCQSELRSCYNFRKRCHEIYSLYDSKEEDEELLEDIEAVEVKCEQTIEALQSDDDDAQSFDSFIPQESDDDDESFIQDAESEKFQCLDCPKSFVKRSHLVAHKTSHENLRLYQCARDGCNSAFNVAARLIRHLRNVHQAEDEEIGDVKELMRDLKPKRVQIVKEEVPKGKVECKICNKVLSNTRYLKEHMTLQHLKNSKYVCKEPGCKKRFKISSLLERHMKKHSGIVDFTCKFCGKGYVERKVYNSHLRKAHQLPQSEIDRMRWSATGCEDGDNKCKDCGLEFKTPHKLFDHRALEHQDGQIFICDICGKVFTSKAFLMSHQKYHKGEKNKKCLKCPSLFTEDKGLRTHLRRVHKMSEEELLALQIDGKL